MRLDIIGIQFNRYTKLKRTEFSQWLSSFTRIEPYSLSIDMVSNIKRIYKEGKKENYTSSYFCIYIYIYIYIYI